MKCPNCKYKLNKNVTTCNKCRCYIGNCLYCKNDTYFFSGLTKEEKNKIKANEEIFGESKIALKRQFGRMGSFFSKITRGEVDLTNQQIHRCGSCMEEIDICQNCHFPMLLTQSKCNNCGAKNTVGLSSLLNNLKK